MGDESVPGGYIVVTALYGKISNKVMNKVLAASE